MKTTNSSSTTSTAAALLGSIKSPAKSAAARENGRKGGRPSALYRVYAVREAVVAGRVERVLGEQIGRDCWGRAAAEQVARGAQIRTEIRHVGGC